MEPLSIEERAAASAVASLSGKRERERDSPDAAGGWGKIQRVEEAPQVEAETVILAPEPPAPEIEAAEPAEIERLPEASLKPPPFFYYRDFSKEVDPDSLTPLTPPGRVPNFPAKMHSILSRPDLADVVCWMPHGRSWRVLKPREFEIRVIPTYFEHAKFSSFIRQANGWGFRRITQGRDRNSYYHELFLRGLPHLCKKMKRPGVNEKQAADPDHEPDLYRISEMCPVPEKAEDDSILLECTLQGGPKARMPIYTGILSKSSLSVTNTTQQLTPHDNEALNAFQQSLGASEIQLQNLTFSSSPTPAVPQPVSLPASTLATTPQVPLNFPTSSLIPGSNVKLSPLAAANQLAFGSPAMAAAFEASSAASQFAAGFAAATALSHEHFRNILGSLAAAAVVPPGLPAATDSMAPPQN